MMDPDRNIKKNFCQLRKQSVSEKTKSDAEIPTNASNEPLFFNLNRPIKSLGKKYAQENIFKLKLKQYHEVVISDEVVKNSKQFRFLKEKIELSEIVFSKEYQQLNETKNTLRAQVSEVKSKNHQKKLTLWELKNQILELKNILKEQQEQTKILEQQINMPCCDDNEEGNEEEGNNCAESNFNELEQQISLDEQQIREGDINPENQLMSHNNFLALQFEEKE